MLCEVIICIRKNKKKIHIIFDTIRLLFYGTDISEKSIKLFVSRDKSVPENTYGMFV